MEFFLKELKFQNNNSDLKKLFPKSKKQRYFIKFKNFERIIIALICPKNQSPQDIVNLAKKLRELFNDPSNKDGSKCKIVLGRIEEGISFKNVQSVHVCNPWWNEARLEQIIGRGVRYKSHATLPLSKRNVVIYKLYLIKPIEFKNLNKITNNNYLDFKGKMLSVDLYLRNYSWLKQQQLITFFKLLQKFKFD